MGRPKGGVAWNKGRHTSLQERAIRAFAHKTRAKKLPCATAREQVIKEYGIDPVKL